MILFLLLARGGLGTGLAILLLLSCVLSSSVAVLFMVASSGGGLLPRFFLGGGTGNGEVSFLSDLLSGGVLSSGIGVALGEDTADESLVEVSGDTVSSSPSFL